MSKSGLSFITVSAAALIAGCTVPIFKTVNIDQGHGYSIDAKQRFILITNKGGPNKDQRIVCAEPSPDALTAQAAAIAAQGGTPTVGVGFGGGSSEAAASIGLRTQTIQLLRDGYYRLCEAHLNGVLSKEQYNLAFVSIDELMITLLAIDAIAGAPSAPAVAISPAVPSASASQNLGLSEAVTGDEGDMASDSTTATSAGSTSVTGAAGAQTIGTVPASRSITSDEAKVLLRVVEDSAKPDAIDFCLSLLADPNSDWYKPDYKNTDSDAVEHMKDFCLGLLTAKMNEERLKDRIATHDNDAVTVAKLEQDVHALKQAKKEADDEVKKLEIKLNAALAAGGPALVELSRSLAEKAIDKPIVVK
jgi:hypothetical protein